jgi:hypothetical protein
MNKINNIPILYSNDTLKIHIDQEKKILYINVIDGKYNKENFMSGIQYYENFWILVNSTNERYYQMFLFNDTQIYPLEFYNLVFKTLKSLDNIFKINLHSSCVVNDSNAMDILKPLLNMYKAVRPFNFVKTIEEGYNFISLHSLPQSLPHSLPQLLQ